MTYICLVHMYKTNILQFYYIRIRDSLISVFLDVKFQGLSQLAKHQDAEVVLQECPFLLLSAMVRSAWIMYECGIPKSFDLHFCCYMQLCESLFRMWKEKKTRHLMFDLNFFDKCQKEKLFFQPNLVQNISRWKRLVYSNVFLREYS